MAMLFVFDVINHLIRSKETIMKMRDFTDVLTATQKESPI